MLISEFRDKINYTQPQIWDKVWSRPYTNYEKHHQVFWNKIREQAKGRILDLGCGSSSCWRNYDGELVGVDFSHQACLQSQINVPQGKFIQSDLINTPLESNSFDTVVLCGVINYYQDLTPILDEAIRLLDIGGKIIITINVIDDFPNRHWDQKEIAKQFGSVCERLEAEFIKGIGWFIVLCYD